MLYSLYPLQGNSVLWKPSDTAVLSNYVIFRIMREAGVPSGVGKSFRLNLNNLLYIFFAAVNFVPADGPVFGSTITKSPYLAGINFTGSVS